MRSWQRDMVRDLNRMANEPCKCENNGDLCDRCDAREQLSRPLIADATVVKTLGQLNAMLKPESQGWTIRRSPAGYYYMTHDEHMPSSGVYVFTCKGTTLGFWRRELAAVIADAR